MKLGTDVDGTDGWSIDFNPASYGGVDGAAVYVQGNGKAGGVKGAVLWNLRTDWFTPVSQLYSLPPEIGSNVFQLSWTAADLQNDIDHFDLQYQEVTAAGTSAWKDWLDTYHPNPIPGAARSVWFSGTAGHGYNIRLRAVDRAGNTEPWIEVAGATTSLSASCTPDPSEIAGQNASNAHLLVRNDFSPSYNLCSSASPGSNDSDWFAVDAQAGEELLVMAIPNGGGTAFTLNLYGVSGNQSIAQKSADYEKLAVARWIIPESGRYYLEVKPLYPEMAGTDMRYQVWIGPGKWYYMPFVGR